MTPDEANARARAIWGPTATASPWPGLARDDFWIALADDPEIHRLDYGGHVTCWHDACRFLERRADVRQGSL
jgi:hypothetical protein